MSEFTNNENTIPASIIVLLDIDLSIFAEKVITEKGYMYLPVMVVDGKEYDFSSAIKWLKENA